MGTCCGDLKIYATSYHEEITGSNTIIRLLWPDGRRVSFAIDCGLFQEEGCYAYNNAILPYNAEDIDFAIATHVHVDHIGRFPYLVKCGFCGDIYTSYETAVLFPIMINDSYSHMESGYRRNLAIWKIKANERKKSNKKGKKDKPHREAQKESKEDKKKKHKKTKFSSKDINFDKPAMLYDKKDMSDTLRALTVIDVNKTFSPCDGLEITFLPNGHINGAVMVYFHVFDEDNELNFFATADMGMKNVVTGVETFVPDDVLLSTNFVLAESTYGYEKEPRNKEKERERHCKILNEILGKKGTVMYLANSLERPQVVFRDLQELQRDARTKDVLRNVPIYLDSTLGISCHEKYVKLLGTDFIPDNFRILESEERENVKRQRGPKIIICTSPRFDQGSFLNYGIDVIENPNYALIFTSFAPPWVSYIIDREPGYKFNYLGKDTKVTKRCQMDKFRCYSAHVSKNQMEQFLSKFENINLILFNHGTNEGKKYYEEYFRTDRIDTLALLYGKTIVITKDGITKIY